MDRPGLWYHLTARGNERRRIFHEDRDREHFLGVACPFGKSAELRGRASLALPANYGNDINSPPHRFSPTSPPGPATDRLAGDAPPGSTDPGSLVEGSHAARTLPWGQRDLQRAQTWLLRTATTLKVFERADWISTGHLRWKRKGVRDRRPLLPSLNLTSRGPRVD
jgi:hypothetical protein